VSLLINGNPKVNSNLNLKHNSISNKLDQEKSFLPFQPISLQRQDAQSNNKFPFPVHFLTKT
jgi:hypothetical protein